MAHAFTLKQLEQAFELFLIRLVEDHGADRADMINYHLVKLVGQELPIVLRRMPRGPSCGSWDDLMQDIRDELREIAGQPVKSVG